MANTSTSPTDATGIAVEKAAKARAKELAEREGEIALSRKAEADSLANDVFDPLHPDTPLLIDEVEEIGVSVKQDDSVIIRATHDIDEMTLGVGQTYSFKQGVKYRVPRSVANHLARLGYTWSA